MIKSFTDLVTRTVTAGTEKLALDLLKSDKLKCLRKVDGSGTVKKNTGLSYRQLCNMTRPRIFNPMRCISGSTPLVFKSFKGFKSKFTPIEGGSSGGSKISGTGDTTGTSGPGGPEGPKRKPGGREDALEFTSQFPEGTVGHVVNKALGKMMPTLRAFGKEEFASGSIGQHYRDIESMLRQPATKENLRALAERETLHWNTEPDPTARKFGSYLTANHRECMLLCTLKKIQSGKGGGPGGIGGGGVVD
ncbi:MAG: hypothetical protein ACAI35_22745 [Candidatus Methylacidiphilales bacterium]|nr:hypothetical protein [Candidatus Methylacidiphilales bacterium]